MHARKFFDFFPAQRCASAVYGVALRLSVCLSVTSRCSVGTAEQIELIFDTETTETTLGLCTARLYRNSGIFKNKSTFSETLSGTMNLADFCADVVVATARRSS